MNRQLKKIDPQSRVVKKLFSEFYIVPDFQREFIWTDVIVGTLLEDIYEAFSAKDPFGSEYFVGSIVVTLTQQGNEAYEIIDGQQRITTFFLMLCAFRDFCKTRGYQVISDLQSMLISSHVLPTGEEQTAYHLKLQYEDNQGLLERIVDSRCDFANVETQSASTANILIAYATIVRFFGRFNSELELKRFYSYVTNYITLVRIEAPDITQALSIFETINERGKSLDSMDLLKNLLFMKIPRQEYDSLKVKWKTLTTTLHIAKEKPLRFLRYFILATYDVANDEPIREQQIYKWFKEHEAVCKYNSRPMQFVDLLLNAASAYRSYLGKDSNQYLKNILLLSGSARQQCILLLAARQVTGAAFTTFCAEVENLLFAIRASGLITRDYEKKFIKWAKALRAVKTSEGLHSFTATYFIPEKQELSVRFGVAFRELEESYMAKAQLLYVLAKFSQYLQIKGFGKTENSADLRSFMKNNIEIEHILSKKGTQSSLEGFDDPEHYEDYVSRLGNLTLIEKTLNASLQNKPYVLKKSVYLESAFLLTKSIPKKVKIGKASKVDRLSAKLESFETWTCESIKRRQDMLARLAYEIWDIPKAP